MQPDDGPPERLSQVLQHGQRCFEVFGLIRRSYLENTRLIGLHFGGDNVLLYRLALLGRFIIVPAPLFVLRRHKTQSTELLSDSYAYDRWFTGADETSSAPDWRFFLEAWRATEGLGLSYSEKLQCLQHLSSEALRRRGRLKYNVRVLLERLLFGDAESGVGNRRRSFRRGGG
jgi:hypothetical protein